MSSLTPAARVTFALAAREADELGSAYLEVEHLFIGVCKADALAGLREGEVPGLAQEELAQVSFCPSCEKKRVPAPTLPIARAAATT